MSLNDEVAISAKALSEVRNWVERRDKDLQRCYQGLGHRQNQQASEIEDLWEKVNAIGAYLKKKFPEDFGGGS